MESWSDEQHVFLTGLAELVSKLARLAARSTALAPALLSLRSLRGLSVLTDSAELVSISSACKWTSAPKSTVGRLPVMVLSIDQLIHRSIRPGNVQSVLPA